MAGQYLIDTNTAIDYLNNKLPAFSSNLIDEQEILISVITRMELLAWPNATREQITLLEDFVNSSFVLNLEEDVILKGIEIRKQYKLKLPDAIIAATAAVFDLTLLSRNLSDFQKVVELEVINPWDMH
jgi:predicted nucleic acid-binding protein